ncbi:MAG TPA: tetratricopeptide repeat protein, partial [Chryseosolibacter sp.]|nr:tetratricopeptide repeat protein [Chryseosolibacter sp.]
MRYLLTFVCVTLMSVSTAFSRSTPTDTLVASRDFKNGLGFLAAQRYDSALVCFQRAVEVFEAKNYWFKTIVCYNKIAESQFGVSDYGAAAKSAENVLKLCAEKLSNDHVQTGYARIVLGNVLMYTKSDVNAALELYNQALETFKRNYGELHADVAKAYVTIAMTNAYFIGRYSMMIEYYNKALYILLKVRDKNHPDIAYVYNSLGNVYKELNDYESAEQYLRKALAIYQGTSGGKNLAVANCLGNIARIHRARKDYKKAIECFERVRKIHQEIYHERHPFVIMVYRGIADVYLETGDVLLAERNYKKGIQIAEVLLSKKHPVISAIYNDLSELFQVYEDLPKALGYAQQAIIANVFEFNEADPKENPPADAYYWEIREFIIALTNKERVLLHMYRKDKNVDHIRHALATIEINDQVLDEFGKYIQDHDDKIIRGAEAASVYETGVEIAFALMEATGEKRYLEKAFYFSEKSKAGILMDALSELKAKHRGEIPSALLEFEKNLKAEQSRYHSQIQQEKSKGPGADESQIAGLSDKLFGVSRRYDSLIGAFEKQYPEYHSLKFRNKIVTISEIQRQLDNRTALLEYFIGKRVAYQFLITKTDFHCQALDSAQVLHDHVARIRNALDPLSHAGKDSTFRTYVREGDYLYQHTLRDILVAARGCDNLIIVPDQALNYVPFDIFLTEPVNASADYKNLPYLLNKYTVSYAYSASVLYNEASGAGSGSSGLIAFAPEYKPVD